MISPSGQNSAVHTMTIEAVELQQIDFGQNIHKFYRAYWSYDNTYVGGLTHWGRIGTKGQFKMLDSAAAARSKLDNKRLDGYQNNGIKQFICSADLVFRIFSGREFPSDYAALAQLFDRAISLTPATPQANTSKAQEAEEAALKHQLLFMAKRLRDPNDPANTEPTMEDRLIEAMKKAQNKTR